MIEISNNVVIKDRNTELGNLTNYTSEEQVIGKWFTNEDIYRRVIIYTVTKDDDRIDTSTFNIKQMINYWCIVRQATYSQLKLPISSWEASTNRNRIAYINYRPEVNYYCMQCRCTVDYLLNYPWQIVMEYTKN